MRNIRKISLHKSSEHTKFLDKILKNMKKYGFEKTPTWQKLQ